MDRAGSNVTQEEEEEDWRTRQDNKTKEVRARGRSRGTRKQQNHRLARRCTRPSSSRCFACCLLPAVLRVAACCVCAVRVALLTLLSATVAVAGRVRGGRGGGLGTADIGSTTTDVRCQLHVTSNI
jgi:hypothetical protein